MTALLVVAGAAVGAPLRFLAGHFLDGPLSKGTLLVNLVGSFLLGVFVGQGLDGNAFALLGTGFCGAFTTYSSMSVQAVNAGSRRGLPYALVTVVGSFALAWLGLQVG